MTESGVAHYLDCGCAFLENGKRSWCPTHESGMAERGPGDQEGYSYEQGYANGRADALAGIAIYAVLLLNAPKGALMATGLMGQMEGLKENTPDLAVALKALLETIWAGGNASPDLWE